MRNLMRANVRFNREIYWNDYSSNLQTLISIFAQNMDEFEKQVQTLESVHPLISKYRQDG